MGFDIVGGSHTIGGMLRPDLNSDQHSVCSIASFELRHCVGGIASFELSHCVCGIASFELTKRTSLVSVA